LVRTFKTGHRLRVFQNRAPREIFGRRNMRKEVAGEWRKWHSEELLNLYSQNIRLMTSRKMR
jgi:hypothetical protein